MPKVRITRAQLRQIQENLKNASIIAKDTKEIEEKLRLEELASLDSELENIN
jgi:hypothetical protein